MTRTVHLPDSPANLHPLPAAVRALLRPGLKVMAHGTEAIILELGEHGLFARVDNKDGELLACRWIDVDICLADLAADAGLDVPEPQPGAPVLPRVWKPQEDDAAADPADAPAGDPFTRAAKMAADLMEVVESLPHHRSDKTTNSMRAEAGSAATMLSGILIDLLRTAWTDGPECWTDEEVEAEAEADTDAA